MYKAFYQQLTFGWLPQLTTIFFFALFVLALAWVFVIHRRKDFDSIAAMPLFDDEVNHER